MSDTSNTEFGYPFERIFVGILSIITGGLLIFLAIQGPLVRDVIHYKTAPTGMYQIMGQDLVNLVLLSSLTIAAGITLILKRKIAKFLIISFPLYLIYYVLSYTVGLEWSSAVYTGNSEKYTFHFLFIMVASVITLLYSLSVFPKSVKAAFNKKTLAVYTVLYVVFLAVFSSMWLKEIMEVLTTGTTRAYGEVPGAFWLIRFFDLGFTIPLGFLSVYLLWTRPGTTAAVQFLFYGFFLTMIVAVNSMGLTMFLKHDSAFLFRDMLVFFCIALVVFGGFLFVLKNCKFGAK